VQKFTRPLTREIELASGRLALTFTEQGIAVRPVGSRKPPWEVTWERILTHVTSTHDAAAALEALKKVDASRPSFPAEAPKADAGAAPSAEATTHSPAASESMPHHMEPHHNPVHG
jgi:hypothetical protein